MEWKSETRKLSELIPWERNPRQLTDEQAKHLQESILKFGQVIPYSIGPDNQIYDGHQRQHVMGMMSEYGKDSEVDVRVSERLLTDEERKELVIRLHENTGEWDFDRLANLYDLDELEEWGFDEDLLTYLDFGDEDPPEDPGPQIDKAEELREKWNVESGQLWQLGKHRVICGDCTDKAVVDRLMGGEKADMVFTDPPYGVGYTGKTKDALTISNDDISEEELEVSVKKWFDVCFLASRPGAYWLATVPPGPLHSIFLNDWKARGILRQVMVWVKDSMVLGHSEYHYRHEPILFGWVPGDRIKNADRTKTTVWEFDRPKASREHPTMKPIEMWEYGIGNHSEISDTLFEPFIGSGTTLIACERLNRKCRGVEIEPKYVAVTLERWAEMTGQEPVLIDG